MSAQVDRIYKLAFRRNFTNYEGNFPPNRQLLLGDYGVMKNGYFSRLGNIADIHADLKVKVLKDLSPGHETFKSSGSVSFQSTAKGEMLVSGAALKASIDIEFESENSVFFSS